MSIVTVDNDGPPVSSLGSVADSRDEVRLWWLGQAGFALEFAGVRILIDPYLSDSLAHKYEGTLFPHRRLHPAPIRAGALRGISAVLHTHAHTDHLDPGTIGALLANNRPTFVAPRARQDVAIERGVPVDRLEAVNAGETIRLAPHVTVEALPAAHEDLELDADGNYSALGYIVTIGGVRLYHSGDCVPFDGLAAALAAAQPDVALLPINGRDSYRTQNGVPGNFTIREAIALAREANVPALVGHHFGLFDFNTVDVAEAAAIFDDENRAKSGLECLLPALGEPYRVRSTSASRLDVDQPTHARVTS